MSNTIQGCLVCTGIDCPVVHDPSSRSGRWCCQECGTIFVPDRRQFHYDASYPEQRDHRDSVVMQLKIRSAQNWIQKVAPQGISGTVMEFGFGSGAYLQSLHQKGLTNIFGVEVVDQNRERLTAGGIPRENIVASLQDISEQVKLDWALYFDSFEHILEIENHMQELSLRTHTGSRVVLVLPAGDSLSRSLLGKAWPHDLPDHWIFHTKKGLSQLFQRHGWRLTQQFHPTKYINWTLVRGLLKKKYPLVGDLSLPDWVVPFNIGERGLVFQRD